MRIEFANRDAVILPLFACGWGYAKPGCKLHQTARAHDLTPVSSYFGANPTEAAPWFAVAEALANICELQKVLQANPGCVCDADCSLRDLGAMEQILREAPCEGFRLSILTHQEQRAIGYDPSQTEKQAMPLQITNEHG